MSKTDDRIAELEARIEALELRAQETEQQVYVTNALAERVRYALAAGTGISVEDA